jgi:hypothetical protein
MSTALFDKFNELVSDLQNNTAVTIVKKSENITPVHVKTIERFQKIVKQKSGFYISEDLLEFIDISNGLQLYWTYDLGERNQGSGEFKLLSLFEVFGFEQPQIGSPNMAEKEIAFLKQFRIFDDQSLSGEGMLSGFVGDTIAELKIYFYVKGDVFPMKLNYEQYLIEMLNLKGFTGWQYLYCDLANAKDKPRILERLSRNLSNLKILFPSENFNQYNELLKQL